MNNSFCFIPAKAASTRLKQKNLLKLGGKELIYYPIQLARSSKLFDANDIIFSTESEDIRQLAIKYGAHAPYLRENKLAYDPYGVCDVLLDFLNKFEKFQQYKSVCILLPTSPFTSIVDVKKGYEVFNSGRFNSVMSVTETEHRAQRSILIIDGILSPLFPEAIKAKSQELEPTYRINGSVIIVDIKELLNKKTYFLNPIGTIVMPAGRSVDIDNEEGYLYAKYLKDHKDD